MENFITKEFLMFLHEKKLLTAKSLMNEYDRMFEASQKSSEIISNLLEKSDILPDEIVAILEEHLFAYKG